METRKSQTKEGKVPQNLETAKPTITSKMGGVHEKVVLPEFRCWAILWESWQRLPSGGWEQGGMDWPVES